MTDRIDCIIAGAGVVGLAIGRRLALAGLEVVLLETEEHIGMHTSSRNSEVIHAGIYYPKDSLKARLCVAGKHALYEYCEQKGIVHQRIGKLIVATETAEEATLESIDQKARANGVEDLRWVGKDELATLEPQVRATAALFSPSTGIVDSHEFMLGLEGDLEAAGGAVVLQSPISGVKRVADGFEVSVDGEPVATSRYFINSAGLWAPELASRIDGAGDTGPEQTYLARGHYFAYAGRSPFSHLIYPVPIDGGLGIHATNDLGGSARFGPDVEWIDSVDYAFPDGLESKFLESIRRYFPGVEADKLNRSYTGIRPKLSGPGERPADFRIDGPETHGVPDLVNLFGMESPALTASLAIADYVHDLISGGDLGRESNTP